MEMLRGIQAQDEFEGMLAIQMVAIHDAVMECLRRAILTELLTAEHFLPHVDKIFREQGGPSRADPDPNRSAAAR
jgi:hypothetical protein